MLAGEDLIAILVVALLLFGPSKLPSLARGMGQAVREFKRGAEGLLDEVETGTKSTTPAQATPPQAPQNPQDSSSPKA
jgi:sec-independent protein translocase protein TatA